VDMTQDGIATALSLSRAHVALELKRLKSTGKVQERMAHVANARSRRKVYELTPAGQEISRRMREHARSRTVELSGPEGRRTVVGTEAIDALRRAGLREAEAIQQILTSDVVELPRPESTKPAAVQSRTFFGRADERRVLQGWLASDSRAVAVVIGVAGIGKSALLVATRTQPTFFEPPDVARGRVLELRLDGLDEASAAELLASRGASLDPGDVPRVIAATGGHPLALELFAASGLDAGAVETEQYVLDTVLEGLDDASEDLLRTFAVLRRPARSPETFGATL